MNRGAWIALTVAIAAAAFLGGRMLPAGNDGQALQVNTELQQTVNALQSRVEALEAQRASSSVSEAQFEDLLARVRALEERSRSGSAASSETVDAIRSSVEELSQTVESLRSSRASAERVSELVERVASLERALSSASDLDSDSVQALQDRIAQLSRQLEEIQGQALRLPDLQPLGDRVSELERSVEALRGDVISISNAQEQELASQQQTLAQLSLQVQDLGDRLKSVQTASSSAEARPDTASVKIGVVDMVRVNATLYRLRLTSSVLEGVLRQVGRDGEFDLILRHQDVQSRELILYTADTLNDVTDEVIARLEAIKQSSD